VLMQNALASAHAVGAETDTLVELINEYRSSPQVCEGRQTLPVCPIAPQLLSPALRCSNLDSLQDALKRDGYTAAQLESIVLSGPASARDAIALLTGDRSR
jgi:hypothetical protein